MLQWTIERLGCSKLLKKIVVATSLDSSDDAVEEFCLAQSIKCHRGSLKNVALRFAQVVILEKVDEFVRISADSPLIDPEIIDKAIAIFWSSNADLVTNTMPRTFPKGQSVEVLSSGHFIELCKSMTEQEDQEHVTQGFYKNQGNHLIVSFTSGIDAGHVQMSVDTPDDFMVVENLIRMSNSHPEGWKKLLSLKATF